MNKKNINEDQNQEIDSNILDSKEELSVRRLIDLGANLGHKIVDKSMQLYVTNRTPHGSLINMEATMRCINSINEFVTDLIVNKGYQVVFIGRPGKISSVFNGEILKISESCQSHFLPKVRGGCLTNFGTTYEQILRYNKLLNDEALLKKNLNLNEKFAAQSIKIIQNKLNSIQEKKLKFANYQGIQNLTSVAKTIFIASDIHPLSNFIKELKTINNSLHFDSWSYLISMADVNTNSSEYIGHQDMEEFVKFKLKSPVCIIPANTNKVAVLVVIYQDLAENIKRAQMSKIPTKEGKK
jgi:ribosomal protein S2